MSAKASKQPHVMELQAVHASGAQEWSCIICERRIMIVWKPIFKRIVLIAGDEFATHNGSNFEMEGDFSHNEDDGNEDEILLPDHILEALDKIFQDSDSE